MPEEHASSQPDPNCLKPQVQTVPQGTAQSPEDCSVGGLQILSFLCVRSQPRASLKADKEQQKLCLLP